MRWFRRHYVFIFICCWKTVLLFQRRGAEALGLRTWIRHWWQQPKDWQGFSRYLPQQGPPLPSARAVLQTENQREPQGSNIRLVPALILPALSRVTVSKTPWSSGAKQRLRWSLHSHLNLAMQIWIAQLLPKQALVPVCASLRNSQTLPWPFA